MFRMYNNVGQERRMAIIELKLDTHALLVVWRCYDNWYVIGQAAVQQSAYWHGLKSNII